MSDQRTDKSVSLTDIAYDAIQTMIVTGKLKPHQLVSESELGRELDCGRTPIREALQRLRFEGFVEVLPRRGILVTAADITGQLELLETRRPLEDLVVRLGARRASDEQRGEMRKLADRLEGAVERQDMTDYLEINSSIHRIEAEATRNRFLKNQITVLQNLSRRFWYGAISDQASFATAAKHHCATLRAIADGDENAASDGAKALLDFLEDVTRTALNSFER